MIANDLELYRDALKAPDLLGYERVMEMLVTELSAERGCFWLEKQKELLYFGDEKLREEFPFSRQAVDSVLDHGRSFLSYDTDADQRLDPTGSIKVNKVRSCLCAACYDKDGNCLVVAYFDTGMGATPFSDDDLRLLRRVLSLVPGAEPVLT